MISHWIRSFRLRTLPLSITSIGMGAILALQSRTFELVIFGLTLTTAVFLQILSNLSNDFGDFVHGADSNNRKGPSRAVQSGEISPSSMRIAIVVFALLSLCSGLLLLYTARLDRNAFSVILAVGLASILAAMAYTLGKKPYGYRGLGDVFVFLFFGWVGVIGTYYLQAKSFDWLFLLPSSSCGLLITGVLNINNIRDIDSDKLAGKNSIPVLIGWRNAKLYHAFLILFGMLLYVCYAILRLESIFQWMFILTLPFFIYNVVQVFKRERSEVDPLLKQLVFSILIFIILIGIGELILM